MSNKQIEMRKIKKIFKLYAEAVSQRMISKQTGVSRNTVVKYIAFFKQYKLTLEEVSKLSLEELHGLFLAVGDYLRRLGDISRNAAIQTLRKCKFESMKRSYSLMSLIGLYT